MSINNLLDTSTVSFNDIMGNGKTYVVPLYQRDYSWKQDQWEDIWADIIAIRETKMVHYMGSIVLQNMGEKKYHVIDGQQRFTTITLIALAVINKLKELAEAAIESENNNKRVELLISKFIGDEDPGSLTYFSKLHLNEIDDSFFQCNLLKFRPPVNVAILKYSESLLWEAYNFFVNKVSELFAKNDKGEQIANFLNKIVSERLMFIQIIVEDELSAYTVFETLNSRGMGLTVTDLLKNYLFSISTTTDLKYVKSKWQKIIDIIGLDNFPVFLRHYWNSKYKLTRQEYLFRAVRESVKKSDEVINLLECLEEGAFLYNALSNYADSFWEGIREIKSRIKELALFKEKQAYPLLMSAYINLSRDNFSKVLRMVSIITFRYTVIAKMQANLKEEIYSKLAVKITNKEVSNISEIAKLLKPMYIMDVDFKNSFSTKCLSTRRGSRIVRYILFGIENHLSQQNLDFEDNPATIEHILPENGSQHYAHNFSQSIHEALVYRLGNYTVLESDKNKECATLPFIEKKEIYKQSQYLMTKQIEANEWSPDTLDRRQRKMADYASSIWRISQYDS